MAGVFTSALAGVVFGLALAAPPGPMNAIIAEESVLRGWLSGVTAGLGAMSADGCFFVLTVFGVVSIVASAPTLHGAMVGIGGLLMLYFAYGTAQSASETFSTQPPTSAYRTEGENIERENPEHEESDGDDGRIAGTGFQKAFVLAMTNPYQILFWLTVGVGMLRPGTLDVLSYTPYVGASLSGLLIVSTGSPALIVGFFAGIGIWVVAFPAALVSLGTRFERFSTVIATASAFVLAGFGVVFLVDAVTRLV